ncbi:MAG TPA: hypothetical protein VIY26_07385 [Acidimicrobiales bacterium]
MVNFPASRTNFDAGYGTKTSEEVDIGTDKIVHQIVMTTTSNVNGQPSRETVVVVFPGYAAPLIVVPPPSNETVSLAQYTAALG